MGADFVEHNVGSGDGFDIYERGALSPTRPRAFSVQTLRSVTSVQTVGSSAGDNVNLVTRHRLKPGKGDKVMPMPIHTMPGEVHENNLAIVCNEINGNGTLQTTVH